MVGGIKMDVPQSYRIEDKYKILIFADTDINGAITQCIVGKAVIPDRQYQYFFYKDRYVGDTIFNYRITNDTLVPIDVELENNMKLIYEETV
jgi:hypothetical protein